MTPATELRLFRGVMIIMAAAICGLVGLVSGFGGLESMAALFRSAQTIMLDAGLRNHVRAISVVFAGFGAFTVWSTWALEERKGAFRIFVVFGVSAGFARATGWMTEGYPGVMATVFMAMELAILPALCIWHARLLRLGADRPRESHLNVD
ncbi:MAG: DUF4345 domain-containing protein [Deltaproteobacteria bacterium]|nr:DUF4345 domain-containing protein [Deltaproteobacteria bacterium]